MSVGLWLEESNLPRVGQIMLQYNLYQLNFVVATSGVLTGKANLYDHFGYLTNCKILLQLMPSEDINLFI